MDFTLKTYRSLLESLVATSHSFQTFAEFLEDPGERSIILRHDVEAKYDHALLFATIQHEYNIRGSYYFRFVPGHYDEHIIKRIASMDHEIGYHYDDLSYCKGDYEAAILRFEKNLSMLREIAPVRTICMEGAPLSRWDNRELWAGGGEGKRVVSRQLSEAKSALGRLAVSSQNQQRETRNHIHYSEYGIIGEPYFDIDFSRVFYLSDTGRRWDGRMSVRDKVVSRQSKPETRNQKLETRNQVYRHTRDIIAAVNAGTLPDQVMMTFHPQRWSDSPGPWLKELVLQNVKNVVKRWMVRV